MYEKAVSSFHLCTAKNFHKGLVHVCKPQGEAIPVGQERMIWESMEVGYQATETGSIMLFFTFIPHVYQKGQRISYW